MKFAFIISFLAGISTVFGSTVLFFKHTDKNKVIGNCLGFASGVMITVSLSDLIPSTIIGLSKTIEIVPSILISAIFIVIGIILSTMIHKCLPNYENQKDGKLYKLGIFSMFVIIMHNIPEGIATFLTATGDIKLGISLAVAIALHNIPEGISISVPIYFSTHSKIKAILYTFISGISEFFGAIIAFLFLSGLQCTIFLDLLYSLIAGIMISLVVDELPPNAFNYSRKLNIIFDLLVGMLFMLIIHFFS